MVCAGEKPLIMQANVASGTVTTSVTDAIATIEFFHPAHNAMPGSQLSKLTEAIQTAGANDSVKVIVLQSAGDQTFCAGASFDELAAIQDIETGKKFFSGFANVINAMRTCPKFIIGRVQGKAIGGGVGLAAAMDYCMATHHATIKLSELAVGIGPFVVGPAVERKVGTSAFMQLAINATEWQTAEWAKEKGLYNEVFSTIEQMDAYILHLSEKLANANPEAMRQLKQVFWQGTEHWNELLPERAAISGQLVLSDFAKQAIQAFKSKT